MLTKEKRNKIIAGAIVLSMLASTAGCGSNENEEQEEKRFCQHFYGLSVVDVLALADVWRHYH